MVTKDTRSLSAFDKWSRLCLVDNQTESSLVAVMMMFFLLLTNFFLRVEALDSFARLQFKNGFFDLKQSFKVECIQNW